MTVEARARDAKEDPARNPASNRVVKVLRRAPVHVALFALLFVWLIPTIGLLINSFRSVDSINSTGWWTVLTAPSGLSLDNYRQVLGQQDLGSKFLNSLSKRQLQPWVWNRKKPSRNSNLSPLK